MSSMNNTVLAAAYRAHPARPTGIVPFIRNEAGEIVVPAGEQFCRVALDTDENLCANTNRYESVNALRLHIRTQHPSINLKEGAKGPATQKSKAEAVLQFAECQRGYLKYIEDLKAIRDDADHAATPQKGTSSATKQLKKFNKSKEQREVAEKLSQIIARSPCPVFKRKRQNIPNQTAMRKAAGMKSGKGSCGWCKKHRNGKCPNLEQDDWMKEDGCQVLLLFNQPGGDDDEDDSSSELTQLEDDEEAA